MLYRGYSNVASFYDIIRMMKYLLIGLCLFFDIIYIVCKERKKNVVGLFAKTLAAFCFITIGYMNYLQTKSNFSYFILLGLIFDGIGDLFLALRNLFAKNVTFLIGSISFLVGHILFIKALLLLDNSYILTCIVGGVVGGSILFYLFDRTCHFSKVFTIVGISYLIIILIMVLLAVGTYITSQTIERMIFMIGAVLFVSSDIVLVLYNFSKKEKWMHPVYSLLYFVAQIFISFSLHI